MTLAIVPVREKKNDEGTKWLSVFAKEETDYYICPDGWSWDSTEEPPLNPNYRGELDLHLSNRNMRDVMRALGYELPEDGGVFPIDEMISRATDWLKRNIDKASDETRTVTTKGARGAEFVDVGHRRGYLNERIHNIAIIVREGKERGATHVTIG